MLRSALATAASCADAYAPGPPFWVRTGTRTSLPRWVRTGGAGRLAPRPPRTVCTVYVLGTRTSHGRTVRTAYRGTPGSERHRLLNCGARDHPLVWQLAESLRIKAQAELRAQSSKFRVQLTLALTRTLTLAPALYSEL